MCVGSVGWERRKTSSSAHGAQISIGIVHGKFPHQQSEFSISALSNQLFEVTCYRVGRLFALSCLVSQRLLSFTMHWIAFLTAKTVHTMLRCIKLSSMVISKSLLTEQTNLTQELSSERFSLRSKHNKTTFQTGERIWCLLASRLHHRAREESGKYFMTHSRRTRTNVMLNVYKKKVGKEVW